MEIVMYKSLKIASILLATTTLVSASSFSDNAEFSIRAGVVSTTFYAHDGKNPGTIIDAAGSTSNFAQNYNALSTGLKIKKGNRFSFCMDVDFQVIPVTYANPSGNITAIDAGLAGTEVTAITLNGAGNNVVGAGTTQSATSAIDLAITGGAVDTVSLKADTGGKMERDGSIIFSATALYDMNEHCSFGFHIKSGQSKHKIADATETVKVNEFAAGFTSVFNCGNGFSLEASNSLLAHAQADEESVGTKKQDMYKKELKVTYTYRAGK